jgi:hypothetical protein
MSKNNPIKIPSKKIILWLGITLICAVLLKRDSPSEQDR